MSEPKPKTHITEDRRTGRTAQCPVCTRELETVRRHKVEVASLQAVVAETIDRFPKHLMPSSGRKCCESGDPVRPADFRRAARHVVPPAPATPAESQRDIYKPDPPPPAERERVHGHAERARQELAAARARAGAPPRAGTPPPPPPPTTRNNP